MNELLKGFIGAELTLLGVPGQVTQDEPFAGHGARIPHGKGADGQDEDKTDESRPAVAFDQRDYRTAAG